MNKKTLLAFILILVCVIGVAGLQLYFTFSTYKVESVVFERNANDALKEAVDSAFEGRYNDVKRKLQYWLNDSTFITISAKWNPRQKTTVFTIKQVVPTPGEQNEMSMSLEYFKKRLDTITPIGKRVFVAHMVDYVDGQLREGSGWYYTYKLGDSINKAAWELPLDKNYVTKLYKHSLAKRNIDLPFTFNEDSMSAKSFTTRDINIALKKNPEGVYIKAAFANTDMYVLEQLKWIIMGSVVLVLITLGTFAYMLRTLLSQQKLNALKDDFISNMTHEIHSPLSSVMITAEALKEFDMTKEERDTYADIILYQSKKLISLADEILAGAKLEKKGISLEDTIDLKILLANVAESYKDKAQVSYYGEAMVFKGNESHFERAITNVVDNAIKYNESAVSKVDINTAIKEGIIEISIADNGPGIQDAYKTKVFDHFYRIPTGNIHNVKGYGLGLSYVKKVLLAHKGNITIKDNQPSGSIFIIRIPNEI